MVYGIWYAVEYSTGLLGAIVFHAVTLTNLCVSCNGMKIMKMDKLLQAEARIFMSTAAVRNQKRVQAQGDLGRTQ